MFSELPAPVQTEHKPQRRANTLQFIAHGACTKLEPFFSHHIPLTELTERVDTKAYFHEPLVGC